LIGGSGGSSSEDEDRASGSLADEVVEREKAEQQAMDAESGSSSKPSQDDVPDRQVAPEAPASASGAEQASEDYNSPAPQTGGGVTPPVAPSSTAPKAPADVSAYVTPLVRKLAAAEGVDLSTVTGTGVGGRIRKEDVLKAAEAAKAKAAPSSQPAPAAAPSSSAPKAPAAPSISAKRGTTEKMTRLRKVIAQRMVESLQISAQLTTVVEVDVTRIAKLRERAKDAFKAREGASLSYLPFITLATVEALKQYPQVNASIEGESIVYHPQENIGIAVDTERGLLVPVVKDAGDLNLAGIARKIGDLAKRTRDNKVTPDELGGGTFTITNTGSRGALFDTPIINQPQVGILGTGAVVKRPAVVTGPDGDDVIAVRSMMYLALSYDHRLVDGADAARFLVALKTRLEEGAFEAELGL
ncbi:2-oxoglutarate dehydrogenase, E2 component, dihydrolipoamide succinyltransferase, partial [Quadrisphaera oryzae]